MQQLFNQQPFNTSPAPSRDASPGEKAAPIGANATSNNATSNNATSNDAISIENTNRVAPASGDARRFLRGLYVITDERLSDHIVVARAAIEGGATVLQLRDKTTSLSRLLPIALEIRRICSDRAAFIINDRVDLALACGADGVHLGPDDLPLDVARQLLGPDKIIGASCNNEMEARQAQASGADYIGAGAVFSTSTKSDAGAPIGTEALRRIVQATNLPVAAIGGINFRNIAQARQSGAIMLCVVSAVCAMSDEEAMMQATRELVEAVA